MENKRLNIKPKDFKKIKIFKKELFDKIELLFTEYLLVEEQISILKKHFKLTPKEFANIINIDTETPKEIEELLK